MFLFENRRQFTITRVFEALEALCRVKDEGAESSPFGDGSVACMH